MFKNLLKDMGEKIRGYLVWDDPYETEYGQHMQSPRISQENKNSMITDCSKCEYCTKVLAPSNPPTWNVKCNHPIGDIIRPSGRIIKFRADSIRYIEQPSWCPLLSSVSQTAEENTSSVIINNGRKTPKRWQGLTEKPNTWDVEKRLNKFKSRVNFKDVKIGDVIHVPPLFDDPRMDVRVTSVSNYGYSLEGVEIGNETHKVYLYDTGLRAKIMSLEKKTK